MKLYVIPHLEEIDKWISLSKEHNLGFEYNEFFNPNVLDNEHILNELITKYKDLNRNADTLHGVFFDINLVSNDQKIKENVKLDVEDYVYSLLKDVEDIDDARNILTSKIDTISSRTSYSLKKQNVQLPYSINFGLNYFPEKEYKGITYEEGYYESLLITLGNGLGDNWWCVLFPPLCLLEASENTEVEYTTLVGEILKKYKS